MLRREETASAFLATLLDYDPSFRQAFLRLALDEPGLADEGTRTVRVEEDRVDVTPESEAAYVVIENKIGSGAKQQGQLLRYYEAAVTARPTKRIIAVYLAPRGIGLDEVTLVQRCALFSERRTDVASHLPWERVTGLVDQLPAGDAAWFARSGMHEIGRAIVRAQQVRHPVEEDRALVRDIADQALALLANRCPDVALRRGSGQEVEEILTSRAPVTIWLDATFDVEAEVPFTPVGLVRQDGIHLTVRSQFKLAGRVKKDFGVRPALERTRQGSSGRSARRRRVRADAERVVPPRAPRDRHGRRSGRHPG